MTNTSSTAVDTNEAIDVQYAVTKAVVNKSTELNSLPLAED